MPANRSNAPRANLDASIPPVDYALTKRGDRLATLGDLDDILRARYLRVFDLVAYREGGGVCVCRLGRAHDGHPTWTGTGHGIADAIADAVDQADEQVEVDRARTCRACGRAGRPLTVLGYASHLGEDAEVCDDCLHREMRGV